MVSRGTNSGPSVRPLLFRKYLKEANSFARKDTTRRQLVAGNCEVVPGTFEGLNFDTGRVRPQNLMRAELRAQCEFESGRVRVVSVFPTVRVGDLFWVKSGRFGSRKASDQTIRIQRVRVARVQDMTDEDCRREGIEFLPRRFLEQAEPRLAFARLWDDINGPGSWTSNPWVWIYEYRTYNANVDEVLETLGHK